MTALNVFVPDAVRRVGAWWTWRCACGARDGRYLTRAGAQAAYRWHCVRTGHAMEGR